MPPLRVLDNANKSQQRLGYLKYLLARCMAAETSSLQALGRDLASAVTRSVPAELTPALAEYVRLRLTDGVYKSLRAQVAGWDPTAPPMRVLVELQDLYLASPFPLPSRTGKLVSEDWRKYPYLDIELGLIRSGTWSPLDRGVVLLRLTPKVELEAFNGYIPEGNPLVLSQAQRILLCYCFLENDGDVLKPLYARLRDKDGFSDRDAGDLMPEILRAIVRPLGNRSLPAEERGKLERLLKLANSIEKWYGKPYTGGSAREEFIRLRLEPFVDLGLLLKGDPYRYEYGLSPQGRAFFAVLDALGGIGEFLDTAFFRAWAAAFGPAEALVRAWNEIKGPLGYAPIVDVALLAGSHALTQRDAYFEVASARQLLRDWQKESPTALRFEVDRMGNMAHVRLLEPQASVQAINNQRI